MSEDKPRTADAPVKRRFLPKFPIFVQDWLGSLRVLSMTAEQEGGFLRLCLLQWQEGGLPDDDPALLDLARVQGLPGGHRALLDAFQVCDDGMRRCEKVSQVRDEVEGYYDEQARKSALGVEARKRRQPAGQPTGSPRVNPRSTPPTPTPTPKSPSETKKGWAAVLGQEAFQTLCKDLSWRSAWDDWIAHVQTPGTKGRPPTASMAKAQFNAALKHGAERHAEAIRLSIANDYQGINVAWVKDAPARNGRQPQMSHAERAIADFQRKGGRFTGETL